MPSMDDVYGRPGTEDRPRSTTRKEAPLGPRQPDTAVCSGCGDGVAQSIGNFPVVEGGGYNQLCKMHAPIRRTPGNSQWRAADSAPPVTPFQATDADIDYLDAACPPSPGVVVDHGYDPTPPAYLAPVALEAVPVAAGTIERLTRNANADVMVRSLGGLVARLEALPARVTSDEEQGTVAALLTEAAAEERNIEALRETLKAPYLAACRTIDGAMGAASLERKTLGVMRVRMSSALGAYQAHRASVTAREAEEARLRAVQAAEAEAAALARMDSATTYEERHRAQEEASAASLRQLHATLDAQDAETPQKGVRTEAGTLGFTQPWKVEVVDEALVPREFLKVDTAKLDKAIAGKDGLRSIPGCNIYQGHGLRIGK